MGTLSFQQTVTVRGGSLVARDVPAGSESDEGVPTIRDRRGAGGAILTSSVAHRSRDINNYPPPSPGY